MLMAALGGIVALGIIGMLVVAWFSRDLPKPGQLSQSANSSAVFMDRNDRVLFEISKDKSRVPVDYDEISQNMVHATVAIEDKNFFQHKGISEIGIIRSLINLLAKHSIEGGGSTITQQLIKNVLLDARQTPSRKIKEIILAIEVERRYSKEQILSMYLNEVPYGGSFWGVESAAQGYFGKPAKDLTVLESAILAGLPQSPSRYSPFIGEKDLWKARTTDVLRRMREDKYITKDDEKKALADMQKLKFSEPKLSIAAPHFVFYVRDLIKDQFGANVLEQGIRVKTTLDYKVQKEAQSIVKDEVEKIKGLHVGNGATVVLDSHSADILAMVGSYDYNNKEYGNFNAAVSKRQPGSSIKPITYATAFEKGYTPATVIMDLKTTFPDQGEKEYIPVNYDGEYHGPVQLRFALANSYNIPAVKLLAMVGINNFLQKASAMGLEDFAPTQANANRYGLAVTLGGGESTLLDMTSAFSVFARGGEYIKPHGIIEIKDNKGKSIYKFEKESPKRVFSKEISFLISHILSDNVARTPAFGPNSYLNIPGKTVAVKTGTTNDKRDNWAIGYTNDVTVGVWVGNNDNSPMNQRVASGVTGASPIWSRVMKSLLSGNYKDGIIAKPDDVVAVEIDSVLGGLPKDGRPKRTEYFVKGTEPTGVSPFYKTLKISKSNGKLANDDEIKSNNYEEKEYIVIQESDPVSSDGKNRWQEAIDAWVQDQISKGNNSYLAPTQKSDGKESSSSKGGLSVSITSPSDGSTVGYDIPVSASISTDKSIKQAKILVDGVEQKNMFGDRRSLNETIHLSDGDHEIKVWAKDESDATVETAIHVKATAPTPKP
jgi:1A family penicillin-binding protein